MEMASAPRSSMTDAIIRMGDEDASDGGRIAGQRASIDGRTGVDGPRPVSRDHRAREDAAGPASALSGGLAAEIRDGGSVRAAEAAVHVDALAGDVARLRRAEERDEIRHVAGIAEVAERDLARELRLVLGRRMEALVDLLAVDAPRCEAVHGDAVAAHIAREPLRPRMHRGLGGAR